METEEIGYIRTIPGTVGFMASENGNIYSPEGVLRKTYKNGDGYITSSVKLLNGKWQTFGVHRLVALAHIESEVDTDILTVNHIDKNISNNNSYNLEWVSVYLNNLHASLMRKNNLEPTLILKNSNGEKFIKNLYEACDILGIDLDLAWNLVKNSSDFKGNYLYVLKSIPESLKKKAQPDHDENGKVKKIPLVVKDLETGIITNYSSMGELALAFNVLSSHIHQCISSLDSKKLFKRKFLIAKQKEELPDLTAEEFEHLKSPTGKNTLLFDKNNNKVIIYNSASELINANNLSKKSS